MLPRAAGGERPAAVCREKSDLIGSAVEGDAVFKAQLIQLMPHVRAFAHSLERRPDADDLAQDALARGWKARASYQPGTNLKAWLFTILRNQFLTGKRRSWRTQPLDPFVAETTLIASDNPTWREDLLDVRCAMELLPVDQREALVLVGAAGMSYEEAARICECAIGTVKSRVSRARATLSALLESKKSGSRAQPDVSATKVFQTMMTEAETLQRRTPRAR
jgi:RNA polymerase sigma-70 factor (ECF subfamily)